MKNIHLLPTEKPSKIFYSGNNPKLLFSKYPTLFKTFERSPQNIYITSDKEIKEGDWRYDIELNRIEKGKETGTFKNWKKIILTTDQDLIKDGVQEIDNEFLEWICKNPSCEKVELKYKDHWDSAFAYYEIIIPKEEPKQETLEELTIENRIRGINVDTGFIIERSYSEEEVKHLMTLAFEQGFKKADVVEAGLEAKETDTEVNWIFLKHKK